MVYLWPGNFAELWHDQPVPGNGHEVQQGCSRPAGSENNTPADRIDFLFLFALARGTGGLPFLHCIIFDLQKQDCMNFSVLVKVMPLKELLDPQGKAVMGGLRNLGMQSVNDVRIGKTIQLQVDAASAGEAKQIAEEAGKKLLANPVMEYFEVSVL